MLTFCYNKQLESFCDFRETNRSITCEVACVKGVRRGRGRELGRETTREGGGTRGTRSRAPKFPLPLLTPAMQATLKGFLNNTKYHYHYRSPSLHCLRDSLSWVLKSFFTMIFIGKANLRAIRLSIYWQSGWNASGYTRLIWNIFGYLSALTKSE